MNQSNNLNVAKSYILSILCKGSGYFSTKNINEIANEVNSIFTVNGKNMLEKYSSIDLKNFADFFLQASNKEKNSNDFLIDLKKEVVKSISATKGFDSFKEFEDIAFKLNLSDKIAIKTEEKLEKEVLNSIQNFVYTQMVLILGSSITSILKSNASSVNEKVSYKNLTDIIVNAISQELKSLFESKVEVECNKISDDVNYYADKVKNEAIKLINEEINRIKTTDIEDLRKREEALINKENEFKAYALQVERDISTRVEKMKSLELANIEFSQALEKKSRELEARFDSIETQNVYIQEIKNDLMKMAEKVIKFCKN